MLLRLRRVYLFTWHSFWLDCGRHQCQPRCVHSLYKIVTVNLFRTIYIFFSLCARFSFNCRKLRFVHCWKLSFDDDSRRWSVMEDENISSLVNLTAKCASVYSIFFFSFFFAMKLSWLAWRPENSELGRRFWHFNNTMTIVMSSRGILIFLWFKLFFFFLFLLFFVGEDEVINSFSESQKFSHWHFDRDRPSRKRRLFFSVMDIMIHQITIIGINILPLRCGRSPWFFFSTTRKRYNYSTRPF